MGEDLRRSGVVTRHRKLRQTNQEEAKGTYYEDQGEEEDGAQGKSGRGTRGVGEGPISAQWKRPPHSVLPSIFGCYC